MANEILLLFCLHGDKYSTGYSSLTRLQERVICLVIAVLQNIEALIGYERTPIKKTAVLVTWQPFCCVYCD
jgi:hypothetical protein